MIQLDPFQTIVAIRDFGGEPLPDTLHLGWHGWRVDPALPAAVPEAFVDADYVGGNGRWTFNAFSKDMHIFEINRPDFLPEYKGVRDLSAVLLSGTIGYATGGIVSISGLRVAVEILDPNLWQGYSGPTTFVALFPRSIGIVFGAALREIGSTINDGAYISYRDGLVAVGWGGNLNGYSRGVLHLKTDGTLVTSAYNRGDYSQEAVFDETGQRIPDYEWNQAPPHVVSMKGSMGRHMYVEVNLENGFLRFARSIRYFTEKFFVHRFPELQGYGDALDAAYVDEVLYILAARGLIVVKFNLSEPTGGDGLQIVSLDRLDEYAGFESLNFASTRYPVYSGTTTTDERFFLAFSSQSGRLAMSPLDGPLGNRKLGRLYEAANDLPQGVGARLPDAWMPYFSGPASPIDDEIYTKSPFGIYKDSTGTPRWAFMDQIHADSAITIGVNPFSYVTDEEPEEIAPDLPLTTAPAVQGITIAFVTKFHFELNQYKTFNGRPPGPIVGGGLGLPYRDPFRRYYKLRNEVASLGIEASPWRLGVTSSIYGFLTGQEVQTPTVEPAAWDVPRASLRLTPEIDYDNGQVLLKVMSRDKYDHSSGLKPRPVRRQGQGDSAYGYDFNFEPWHYEKTTYTFKGSVTPEFKDFALSVQSPDGEVDFVLDYEVVELLPNNQDETSAVSVIKGTIRQEI